MASASGFSPDSSTSQALYSWDMKADLLNPGEEVLVAVHPHWAFLLPAFATVVAVLAAGAAVLVFDVPDPAALVVAGVLVLVALLAIAKWVEWLNIDLAVTTDRLVFHTGFIAKRGIEIPLERINTVFFNQSVLDRVLGSGDLTVESAGEGGQQHFRQVRRPRQLQQEIYRAIEIDKQQSFEAMASAQGAAAPTTSIPQQIHELDQLRLQGVITENEFQNKKQELLDRM